MDKLPDFPLFADPMRERSFKRTNLACGFCGKARGCVYTGTKNGPNEALQSRPICPWCIADGSASRLGITFHLASRSYSDADKELLESRTPAYSTWQGVEWETCCGRPCVFLGRAEPGDLRGRWAGAVPSIFSGCQLSAERVEQLIDSMDPESSPCAYVFQCQECGKLLGNWDQD
jgi:uncharacterized protein CbrC (UPF0167 family)